MSICSCICEMNKDLAKCECPDCKCEVYDDHRVTLDGKEFCSEACASGHASGTGCCKNSCQCKG